MLSSIQLLVEFTGALLIVATMIYTDHNPIFVGLAYTAALTIGKEITTGYFSPLAVFAQLLMKRMTYTDASLNLLCQGLAGVLFVIAHTTTISM